MDAPFPGALFAMDGMLCMLTTKGKHNEYVGRKSLPQMIVLVVCNWNIGCFDISVPDPFSPSIQVQPTYFSTHR